MQDNLQESGTQNPPVAFTAAGLSLALLFSKVFGLLRQMLIAKYFGANPDVDAYVAASRFPTLLSGLAGAGLTASFVPIFSEFLTKKQLQQGWRFISYLSRYLFLVLTGVTFLVEIFAENIVSCCLLPGADPPTQKLTALFLRIIMPYFVFVEFGAFFQSILQVHQSFAPIIFWQLIPNIVIISFLVFFSSMYGILSLVAGFLASGIAFFIFLLPFVLKEKQKASQGNLPGGSGDETVTPAVLRLVKMAAPMILASSVSPLVPLVDQILASYREGGSVATLNYAYQLVQVPLHLIIAAIGLLLFPKLSVHAGEKNKEQFQEALFSWAKLAIFLMIPFAAMFLVLSLPLVRIVYERGAFSPEDTLRVSNCVRYFACGIIGWGAADLLNKGFFAFQNSRTPVRLTFFLMCFNILASVLFSSWMGVNGLAFAATLSALLSAYLLYIFLKRDFSLSTPRFYVVQIAVVVLCGAALGTFWRLLVPFFEVPFWLQSLEKRVFALGVLAILGGAFYFCASVLCKVEEVHKFRELYWGSFFAKVKNLFQG